ncbi:MAG TPA: hypothetical protein VF297_06070 [Pyrinomonadaceae bacterium]
MSEEQVEFFKVGFVFSAALTILCGAVAPEGQGREVFAALGIYPLGLGFLIWPALGYVLAGARSDFGASACLVALGLYNYWVAEQLTATTDGVPALIARLWAVNKLGLAAVAALYVGGQLAVVLPKVWERRRLRVHSRPL